MIIATNKKSKRQPDSIFRTKLEKNATNKIFRLFGKQKKYFLESIKKLSFFSLKLKKNKITPQEEAEINRVVESMEGKNEYSDFMTRIWGQSLVRGGKTINIELDLAILYNVKNKEAIKWIKNKEIFETAPVESPQWTKARDFLRLSNYRGNIDYTTKEKIKKILIKAAEEGYSYQKTAQLIIEQGEAGVFTQARAEAIASNEIRVAYEEGKKQVMDKAYERYSGERDVTKKWLTTGDERVRESHAKNGSDDWIEYKKNFSGTAEFNAPSSEFGCRCVTQYQVSAKKE